ncbi:hypothetical protein BIWAKO_02933 [Bosea sp. BIWAKO-01]|nr:hypothetical protein BIWAKO_02933 [Bosea sp. BIWAKO-01]
MPVTVLHRSTGSPVSPFRLVRLIRKRSKNLQHAADRLSLPGGSFRWT